MRAHGGKKARLSIYSTDSALTVDPTNLVTCTHVQHQKGRQKHTNMIYGVLANTRRCWISEWLYSGTTLNYTLLSECSTETTVHYALYRLSVSTCRQLSRQRNIIHNLVQRSRPDSTQTPPFSSFQDVPTHHDTCPRWLQTSSYTHMTRLDRTRHHHLICKKSDVRNRQYTTNDAAVLRRMCFQINKLLQRII